MSKTREIKLELEKRYKITYPDGTEKTFEFIGGESCKIKFDDGETVEMGKIGMHTSIEEIPDTEQE